MPTQSNPTETVRAALRSFAQVVGAEWRESPSPSAVDKFECVIEEPGVTVLLDDQNDTSAIEVIQNDQMGFWTSTTSGPAEDWGLRQTVDDGNLLTTLYHAPTDSEIYQLSIYGPPANVTSDGIEIESDERFKDDEDGYLLDNELTE